MAEHVILDDSVEGKRVINASGEQIGVVSGVSDGVAYVDPDPGLTDRFASMLGWDDVDADDYPLPDESIERVTNDEIHLRKEF